MKKHFIVGHLFIKYSKILAIFSLVTGLSLSLYVLYTWKGQLEALKYDNKEELISSLQDLLRDYNLTKGRVMDLHGQLMTSEEEDVKLYLDPKIYKSYTKIEHFDDLEFQLTNIKHNSEIFKHLVFKNFSKSTNYLLEEMSEYAIKNNWIDATSTQEADDSEGFNLISVTAVDYQKSRETISNSLVFLNDLKASVENRESKININSLVNHLNQYQNVMRKFNTVSETKRDGSEDDESSKKRIFVIMDELNQLKKNIKGIITNSWIVDKQYEKTIGLMESERQKCFSSYKYLEDLNTQKGTKLVMLALITFVMSIGSLILADLLKAVFMLAVKV